MNIAIVEDDPQAAELLQSHIQQYLAEKSLEADIDVYQESITFMDSFRSQYDVLFMDIDLPGQNGMSNAEELRQRDSEVVLIFVTNMPSYAVKGYLVNALDFLVKPVNYVRFTVAMNKALKQLDNRQNHKTLVIKSTEGLIKMNSDDILYVTVSDHLLCFNCGDKNVQAWMSFKEAVNQLQGAHFSQPNKGLLVNLKAIKRIQNNEIELPGKTLFLSRTRKKQFMKDFEDYCKSL